MNFIKKIRNIFLIFMACSFLGWIYEVLVGIFETHVGYVNRGYLFGPYLPIYGFGGLMLIALLTKVRDKKFSAFIYFGLLESEKLYTNFLLTHTGFDGIFLKYAAQLGS